jgi:hypothetical protein
MKRSIPRTRLSITTTTTTTTTEILLLVLLLLLLALLTSANAKERGANKQFQSFFVLYRHRDTCCCCSGWHHHPKNCYDAIFIRGGGKDHRDRDVGYRAVVKTRKDPIAAATATVVSVWQHHISPTLQSWTQQLLSNQDAKTTTTIATTTTKKPNRHHNKNNQDRYKKSLKGHSTDQRSIKTMGSLSNSTITLSTILVPSRGLKVTLLALLIAEGLDRIGFLYEDNPSLLKRNLEEFWYYNLQLKLLRCKERIQLF